MGDYKSLLSQKSFVALWTSQFLSQVAIHTLNFLVILIVFEETGSTLATSIVWLVYILPAIIIGPFAAAFVDLVDKRMLLLLTNALQATILALFSFFYSQYIFLAYGIVLMYSMLNQLYVPSEVASLPIIVKKKHLAEANGLFLASYQIALVLGSGLSGIMGEFLGYQSGFLIAAGCLAVAFIAILNLPKLTAKRHLKNQNNLKQKIYEYSQDVYDGFLYIRHHKDVWLPFVTIAGLQASLAVVFVNLPAISNDIVKINPNYSGIAVVGPAGLGAALGIFLIPKYLKSHTKTFVAKHALTILAIGMGILVTAVPYLPELARYPLSILLFIFAGVSFIGIFIPAQTHLQEATPEDMLGRVFGNSWFITTIATVFPLMFSATITELFGPRVMFAVIGISLLIIRIKYDDIVGLKI